MVKAGSPGPQARPGLPKDEAVTTLLTLQTSAPLFPGIGEPFFAEEAQLTSWPVYISPRVQTNYINYPRLPKK